MVSFQELLPELEAALRRLCGSQGMAKWLFQAEAELFLGGRSWMPTGPGLRHPSQCLTFGRAIRMP